MNPLLWKSFLLLFLTLFGCYCEQLVCYSKTKLESQMIYTFFKGVANGFFVDIYPEHPIRDSSTVYMDSLTWNGINILKDSDTLNEFRNTRTLNINKQIQIIPEQSQKDLNIVPSKKTLSQICSTIIYKKPQFMTIPVQLLVQTLSSSSWTTQDCKPQFLLVKQYSQNKIGLATLTKMKEYGYSQINSYQNFVVLVQNRLINQFQNRQNINSPIIKQKSLIPFSKIINQLGTHILKNNITINQLKGNILANQIQISFAKYFSVIDLTQQSLIKTTSSYFLIMQFNSHTTPLTLPKSIKYELLTLESGKYFHITYSSPNNKQMHYFIFDHQYTNTGANGNDFIFSLNQQGLVEYAKFDGNQIKKYRLEDIKRLGQETQKDVEKLLQKQQEILRKEKDDALNQLQRIKQQYALKQKQRQKQQPKSKNSQKEQQQQQQQQTIKDIQTTISDKKMSQSDRKTSKIVEKQPISYLTPQSIFADQNVKNKTIMIIILVCSIMGSIVLTAVVTACIMKRRNKRYIRQRIKHNAQMHNQQQITDVEQQNKSQPDEIQIKG